MRRMAMSMAPSPACLGFSTSVASRIAPAQVPKVGLRRTNCLSFSNPASPNNLKNVPDSPPGMTRPSISSSCSGFLTSTTFAPSSSRRRRCASKSPCRAKTPIVMAKGLFATEGETAILAASRFYWMRLGEHRCEQVSRRRMAAGPASTGEFFLGSGPDSIGPVGGLAPVR